MVNDPLLEEDYFPTIRTIPGLPSINGLPQIEYTNFVPFPKYKIRDHELGRTITLPAYMKTPDNCSIKRMINWNWADFGALLIAIIGSIGTGKSNLLTGLTALFLGDGVKCVMFCDRNLEGKHLAGYGIHDEERGFIPFEIEIWIPNGYKIKKKGKQLHEERSNVHLCEYSNIHEILSSMRKYCLTVIYTECFDHIELLQFWIDFFESASEYSAKQKFMFIHHELAKLFPESPAGDINKLVKRASQILMDFRKFNIGLLTSFHISSEVFFQFTAKFGYIVYKRPALRSTMRYAEKKAIGYNIQQSNISLGGYYRKHTIGKFPEYKREQYMIFPTKKVFAYPELVPKEQVEDQKNGENDFLELIKSDPVNLLIWNYHLQTQCDCKRYSLREIAKMKDIPMGYSSVKDRLDKMKEKYAENY